MPMLRSRGIYSLKIQGFQRAVLKEKINPAYTTATASVAGRITTLKLPANTSPTLLNIKGTNIRTYAKVRITVTLHPTGNKDGDSIITMRDTIHKRSLPLYMRRLSMRRWCSKRQPLRSPKRLSGPEREASRLRCCLRMQTAIRWRSRMIRQTLRATKCLPLPKKYCSGGNDYSYYQGRPDR